MDAAMEDLKQSVNLLEETFLQDKPFIVGNNISLADLVAIVEIMQVNKTTQFDLQTRGGNIQICTAQISNVVLQPVGTGVDVFEGHPKLSAWRDRVKKEVGEKLFNEAHEAILNIRSLPQKLQGEQLEMVKVKFQKLFR